MSWDARNLTPLLAILSFYIWLPINFTSFMGLSCKEQPFYKRQSHAHHELSIILHTISLTSQSPLFSNIKRFVFQLARHFNCQSKTKKKSMIRESNLFFLISVLLQLFVNRCIPIQTWDRSKIRKGRYRWKCVIKEHPARIEEKRRTIWVMRQLASCVVLYCFTS